MQALDNVNLKINFEKYMLVQEKIIILRNKVTIKGIRLNKTKVEAIYKI